MLGYKGENFRGITMIPKRKHSYSLKVKGRVKTLERGWQRLRTVGIGSVRGTQHEKGQYCLN